MDLWPSVSHILIKINISRSLQKKSLDLKYLRKDQIGGGINSGNYRFYQAQVLDGKTELRGYRKTRFYGDRKFYANFEVRLRLLNFRSYLFPATLGILGFHDLGRIWYKNENGIDSSALSGKSDLWHKGWGGGIWFTGNKVYSISGRNP